MNRQLDPSKVLRVLKCQALPEFNNITAVAEFVTEYLLRKYNLCEDNEINHGYCFVWAYLVWALWKEPVSFLTGDGHVCVVFQDRYYDSVHPYGTDDAKSVMGKYFDEDDHLFVNVKGFAWYWTRCGIAKKVLRSYIRNTYKSAYNFACRGGFGDGWDVSVHDIP